MNALVYFDMDHRNIKSHELKNDKKKLHDGFFFYMKYST